LGLIAFIKKIS